jgi:hypothetical protein
MTGFRRWGKGMVALAMLSVMGLGLSACGGKSVGAAVSPSSYDRSVQIYAAVVRKLAAGHKVNYLLDTIQRPPKLVGPGGSVPEVVPTPVPSGIQQGLQQALGDLGISFVSTPRAVLSGAPEDTQVITLGPVTEGSSSSSASVSWGTDGPGDLSCAGGTFLLEKKAHGWEDTGSQSPIYMC